ncbi:MAG: ABC transporter substrate-binding protein [Oscillospiraceae bacterium]|nr:ABC transporter substrate-binding protein [Oscillospiraceae bacterium]
MKNVKKVLALLLAVVMVLGLAACAGKQGGEEKKEAKTLVASVEQGLEGKFSPFFSLSQADSDIVGFVSLATFPVDRVGNPVLKGIKGETRSYNGTDYTYYGAADVEITENEDGTVYYDLTMRDDIVYTDGSKATIDDLIFGMYVVLDPTYDGNITMYSLPIEGLDAYRSGMDSRLNLLLKDGPGDYTATDYYTQEQHDAFWSAFYAGGEKFAQEIVDYMVAAAGTTTVAEAAAGWGYELAEDATAADFFAAIVETMGYDLSDDGINYESAGTSISSFIEAEMGADAFAELSIGVETGESAPSITGIQRTGDYSMRVVTTELDATAILQMSMYIAPMAYYGDASQYNYENNQFGFPKGDLSIVRAKTTQPLGAGPYIYKSYENGTVHLEANPDYIYGAPKIDVLDLRETSEANKTSGVVAGTIDIADPSYSTDTAKEIAAYNGFSEDEWEKFDGPVLTTKLIDYLGYGYCGVNPNLVKVGDDPYSDASKNLRKAINTVLAVYRDEAIDSYYGNTATVINYPISNTSWAAPQTTDAGYQIAYSVDVNGNPIYTADMDANAKYAAALEAALGYLEAAGFTVADGKVTAAPAGAKLSYQAEIGGGGTGDHPLFLLLQNASDALASIGITFSINDHTDASALYQTYQQGTAEFWCAAWGSATDPDMFQLYHSEGSTNYYHIKDAQLDKLIMDGRASTDNTYRKSIYKSAMEIILDYGVEVPMYQRSNAFVFSTERVNVNTLPGDMTPYWGWAAEIQTLEMN